MCLSAGRVVTLPVFILFSAIQVRSFVAVEGGIIVTQQVRLDVLKASGIQLDATSFEERAVSAGCFEPEEFAQVGVRLENGNYPTLRLTDGFMTKSCLY